MIRIRHPLSESDMIRFWSSVIEDFLSRISDHPWKKNMIMGSKHVTKRFGSFWHYDYYFFSKMVSDHWFRQNTNHKTRYCQTSNSDLLNKAFYLVISLELGTGHHNVIYVRITSQLILVTVWVARALECRPGWCQAVEAERGSLLWKRRDRQVR